MMMSSQTKALFVFFFISFFFGEDFVRMYFIRYIRVRICTAEYTYMLGGFDSVRSFSLQVCGRAVYVYSGNV